MTAVALQDLRTLADPELARLIAAGDRAAVRLVTERNNQRLFRAAWSILKNREEAEDAVQSAYLNAFAATGAFTGRSPLPPRLPRIVISEGLGRARAAKRRRERREESSVVHLDEYREKLM